MNRLTVHRSQTNLALSELSSERFIPDRRLGEAMRVLTERVAHTLGVARWGVSRFTEAGTRIECLHLYEREGDRHGTGGMLTMAECLAYVAALREGRVLACRRCPEPPSLPAPNSLSLKPNYRLSWLLGAVHRPLTSFEPIGSSVTSLAASRVLERNSLDEMWPSPGPEAHHEAAVHRPAGAS